jgi:hypothetical protein
VFGKVLDGMDVVNYIGMRLNISSYTSCPGLTTALIKKTSKKDQETDLKKMSSLRTLGRQVVFCSVHKHFFDIIYLVTS